MIIAGAHESLGIFYIEIEILILCGKSLFMLYKAECLINLQASNIL